jgi:sarcosine oxidase, subunit beta
LKNADIVIIGCGVVGASVAYHLTERGCREVLILDRNERPGFGSTCKATGGVRAQFGSEINTRLSLYSLDFFSQWDHNSGYDPRGYLFLATRNEQLGQMKEAVSLQRSAGYDEVEILDADAVRQMVPLVNCEDVVGGTFGPRDGLIEPLLVLDGFLSRAVTRGARVQTKTSVQAIIVENGKVTALQTTEGKLECSAVVLCTGAWSREIAATAGLDVPVTPLRRHIIWARGDEPLPTRDYPMVVDAADGFHFRPAYERPAEVMFAYPDPNERPGYSTEVNDQFIAKVYEKARHRAPILAETQVLREKCRAGLYENTPDHHPIVGECDIEGLYLAVGFSGHGVMHSPATGRALSEIILDGQASFLDVRSLSLDRFARGKLLYDRASI